VPKSKAGIKIARNTRRSAIVTSIREPRLARNIQGDAAAGHQESHKIAEHCSYTMTVKSPRLWPLAFTALYGTKHYSISCMGLTLGAGRERPSDSKWAITSSITSQRSAYSLLGSSP